LRLSTWHESWFPSRPTLMATDHQNGIFLNG
jgi:hypothetical protein